MACNLVAKQISPEVSLFYRLHPFLVYAVLCLAISGNLAAPAHAQTNAGLDPKSAALLDDYAMINGGWILNQHCNLLDRESRREFEWNLANVNQSIGRTFDRETLAPFQNGAEKAINDPKYADCGEATMEIISSTTDADKYMKTSLTQRP